MKAYSVDLRTKVLRAVDQGHARGEIVKLLGVSRATIKRYLKQRRETGDVAVLALDMVDNSLSLCERISGRLFLHIAVQQDRFILSLPTSICSELL